MKNILKIIVCAFLAGISCACIAADARFGQNGVTASLHVLGAGAVNVHVTVSNVDDSYPFSGSFSWGGDAVFHPKKFISAFTILINKDQIQVPLSAYIDLASPNEIFLSEKQGAIEIEITGGDAAGAYKATFTLEKSGTEYYLKSRKVELAEFPEQAWEHTEYSPPVKTN